MKNIIFVLVMVIACLCFTSCGKDEEKTELKTINIVDCMGREVTVPKKVNRIVDLGLDGSKTLIQIGEKEKIVGLTGRGLMSFEASENGKTTFKWSLAAEVSPELKNTKNVGMSFREPNIEEIISLNPDVIFMPVSSEDKIKAVENQTGVPVLCMNNNTSLDYKMLKIVGKLVGKEDKSDDLINYAKKTVKEITDITSKIPEDKRVKVFLVTPSPLNESELKTTKKYDPIVLAGGINLAKNADVKISSYAASKEQIAVWNPDVILIMSSYCGGGKVQPFRNMGGVENILNDTILSTTNAVKNKRVYTYLGWDYGWDIPTGITQVPYMAKLFYPDEFKDLDVEKKCNEILEKFYGIKNLHSITTKKMDLYTWEQGK